MEVDYFSYVLKIHELLLQCKSNIHSHSLEPQFGTVLEQLEQINYQIQSKHFQVVVLGEFKRGKSTFVNALLQKEVLPADVLPTTATINRIVFGIEKKARILWKDGRQDTEISLSELGNYVTKLTSESETQAQMIQEAVIEYPCMFCQNNVELLDTPGLNDSDELDKVVAQRMSDADLIIYLLSPTAPFSITEAKTLQSLIVEHGICHIIFVLNKMDTIRRSKDKEQILGVVRDRISTYLSSEREQCSDEHIAQKLQYLQEHLRIYPISAADALESYESGGNFEQLQESGFYTLLQELPEMVLLSQNYAAIYKPLRMLQEACRVGQRQLDESARIKVLLENEKNRFASIAYEWSNNTDFQTLFSTIKAAIEGKLTQNGQTFIRSILEAVFQIPPQQLQLRYQTMRNMMQNLFKNHEMDKIRSGLPAYLKEQYICPHVDNLILQLQSQLSHEMIALAAAQMNNFQGCFHRLMDFSLEEPFYWQFIPDISVSEMSDNQKVKNAVSDMVNASVCDYTERCMKVIKENLRALPSAQEAATIEMVMNVFKTGNQAVADLNHCSNPDIKRVFQEIYDKCTLLEQQLTAEHIA